MTESTETTETTDPSGSPEAPAVTSYGDTPKFGGEAVSTDSAPPDGASAEAAPAEAAPVAERPEWLSEDLWDSESGVLNSEKALEALKSAQEAESLRVTDPSAFKFETSVTDSDGNPVEINPEDPVFEGAREILAKHGMTQEAVNDLVNIVVTRDLAFAALEQKQADEAYRSLGEKRQERATSLRESMKELVGSDGEALFAGIRSKAQFEAYEKLVSLAKESPSLGSSTSTVDLWKAPIEQRLFAKRG